MMSRGHLALTICRLDDESQQNWPVFLLPRSRLPDLVDGEDGMKAETIHVIS